MTTTEFTRVDDWSEVVTKVLAGDDVPRHRLLWAIGRHYACHPVYVLAYARTGDPKVLAPEMSGSRGVAATKRAVEFETWKWRPITDKERSLHLANGCPNCQERMVAAVNLGQATSEERAKITGSCPDPQTTEKEVVLKVRWTEVGRFLKGGLTDESVADMAHFMARRKEFAENKDVSYKPVFSTDPQEREAWRERMAEQTKAWNTLEDEGWAHAAAAWDRALGVAAMDFLRGIGG